MPVQAKHLARATSFAENKRYPDGQLASSKARRMATRMVDGQETVRVQCDYSVQAKNPGTGKTESVVFKGVPQDRPTGRGAIPRWWGGDGFDAQSDTDSSVLKCEGAIYKRVSTPSEPMMGVSMPVMLGELWAEDIPALADRVATYERTGETGNPVK